MKTTKRIISTILVVVICLTMAPLNGFMEIKWEGFDFPEFDFSEIFTPEAKAATSGYYTYSVSGNKATITDVNTKISGNITIPSTLDGYPVTSIGDEAFYYCYALTSVTIPDSVTFIGRSAFYYCYALTSVTIPDSVTSIGEGAFQDCETLTSIIVDENNSNYSSDANGVLFNKNRTTLIQYPAGSNKTAYTIPDSVTYIGYAAFAYCKAFTSVSIPDSVTSIGERAFHYCSALTSVTIPDSVTFIGRSAFSYCYALTSVTIPDSVASIGERAFYYCSDLTSVTIGNSVTSIGRDAFKDCSDLTSVTIGNSVTSIGSFAFSDCSDLTSVTIPDSVTSIGSFAFYHCYDLTSVTIPDSVSYIGERAFKDCDALTSVTIPDSVASIGERAFSDCDALTSVTIPDSVTSIGSNAFSYCSALTSIIVDENNSNYSSDANGVLFNKNRTTLIQYPAGSNKTAYTIPDSVTYIGYAAFAYCKAFTSVSIPDSVTSIGSYAFLGCIKLTDVYYSGTQEQWKKISIGSYNEKLTSATIHYNYNLPQTSYFMVSSDQYSVDSINHKETATYKINLLNENSTFLPIDDVTVQNNTTDIVSISTKKVSDTELELTVEPIKDGEASISLFNGDNSNPQYFNFTVYSNTTTYRADQVPVTNEKLKTNFSRGDMTVDNFEYIFDENKGKYIATMDVYNRSGAIGVVAAYTQDGKISAIEQIDPYVPLPGDFGEFLVYLGTGAVSIAKGENWNYRYSGYCQKTSIEIEVPEDGYLTVSCDVTSDNAAFIYNLVSIGVDFAFKTAEVIDVLGTDTDKLAKDTTKTLAKKVSEYFNEDSEWTKGAIKKLAKKLSKQLNMAYLEEISVLSLEMLDEMYKNVGEDFSDAVLDVIIDLTKEEIKEFGVMAAAKNLVKDKVIGTAEKTLLKAASIMFDGGSYVNLVNSILGAYRYNVGTGKTMVVFKPKGEDGFICKDTIKVKSDIITDEVLLHTYIIKDTQKEDAFVRKTIYSDFNRGDGLRKEELSIDLNRIVEIHEISLWKNGQEVFDTFTATVEMNLPSYIDRKTCSIYRVEKDGTYTKLDTRIEGNKIIFETNHFSEYILTGVIEDLQETTPCDEHVYDEVKVEPTCIEAGSITYTCYCGDTYTEDIPKLGHNFSKDFTIDKKATYTEAGAKSKHCLRSGCNAKSEVTAIPKLISVFKDNDAAKVSGKNIVTVAGVTVKQLLVQAGKDAVIKDSKGNVIAADNSPVTGMTLTMADGKQYTIVVFGDADGDGKVSAADARLALRASVGLENYKEDSAQYKAANVGSEDKLSAADARLILRASVGLEDPKSWMK